MAFETKIKCEPKFDQFFKTATQMTSAQLQVAAELATFHQNILGPVTPAGIIGIAQVLACNFEAVKVVTV